MHREPLVLGNCTIPKGALLLLAFHVLHRDKSVWGPTPEKFDPDHFLPEKVAQRHPYAFLPFSGGPRNCIGTCTCVSYREIEFNDFVSCRNKIRLDVDEGNDLFIGATL